MANYCSATRSSYFLVTDKEKYQEIMRHVVTDEEPLDLWCKEDDNTGNFLHAFGGYSSILGYVENLQAFKAGDEDPSYDAFLEKLSGVIAPGSACVIMQAGNEKLRYVDGFVDVVMPGIIVSSSLESLAQKIMTANGINADTVEMYC